MDIFFGSSKNWNIFRGHFYAFYTHYHNSNLTWHTISRQVDEVIPSDDHTLLVSGDAMV